MNVVLTTYHTLSADWKAWKAGKYSVIFSVCWRRVILDEAHIIRNLKSRMSRSVCEIDAQSRWAVTGTPVQNHLSDLAALLKFVRVSPYDDPRRFETDISRLWKSGEDELAVKRLKYLSRCLVLRRAKNTIDLPARHDKNCPVDFSPAEKVLYEGMRQQTITKLDDALRGETEAPTSATYINFLQQIESMRLVCNLGLYYHKRHDGLAAQWASEWANAAQEAFNVHREMNNLDCSQCSTALDLTDVAFDDNLYLEPPQFSRCLKYACPDCTYRLRESGLKMVCGHTPRCPVASISLTDNAFSDSVSGSVSNALPQQTQLLPSGLPSKIEVLIADINALPTDTKWQVIQSAHNSMGVLLTYIHSIVFSTWRLTLDLVESGLNQANIRSVRFDGKVPQAQRQSVLTQFKTDPNIRIMLLTLSCGAVGLTLTEASRAYLMEPHWNPTIEEQALARIHRIGQLKEVTTIRFYIRDSFEETVMEVQEKKRNLAGVLLSGHDGGQADDSLGALQVRAKETNETKLEEANVFIEAKIASLA
jgi:SNF2 family DNA or RNA helicase